MVEKHNKLINDKNLHKQGSENNQSECNKPEVIENCKQKKKLQKERKKQENDRYPKLAQEISFNKKALH